MYDSRSLLQTSLTKMVVLSSSETSFIEGASDPSDRTLIRVLRSQFDEEEKDETTLKARKTRKGIKYFK